MEEEADVFVLYSKLQESCEITELHNRKWSGFMHKLAPEATIVQVSATEERRRKKRGKYAGFGILWFGM